METVETINSQNMAILKLLQEGHEVTPQFAMVDLGCFRLGARIFDLRQMGHPIMTTMKTAKNRFGHTVQFASYKLEPVKDAG
jgi:hypothetical protein